MSDETPELPYGLVTEEDIARLTGMDVSSVRLMMSGAVPIPEHLKAVFPKPVTEVTGYVWRPEDVEGLPEKIAQAEANRELAERRRAEAEQFRAQRAAEAEAAQAQAEETPFAHITAREERRTEHADMFGGDHDVSDEELFLPTGLRDRDRPGWLTGVASSVRAATSDPVVGETNTGRKRSSARKTKTVNVSREDQARRKALAKAEAAQAKADALEAKKARARALAEAKAARKLAAANQKAEKKRAAAEAKTKTKTKTPAAAVPAPVPVLPKQTVADATPSEVTENVVVVAGGDGDAKAKAPKSKAKTVKADALEAKKARARAQAEAKAARKLAAAQKKAPKQTPEQKKALAVAAKEAKQKAAEDKKIDKIESAAAKKRRKTNYKAAITKWKVDKQLAKNAGTRPPSKPKQPKNNTSKPKLVDINNAIRALATMLENTPGELDAVSAMVEEYDGTLLGEAFRRIKYRVSDQNATLVQAFAPEKVFPPEVHNMLAVGEKTIDPGPALRTAVKLLDASNDSRRKLRSQIMEPVIVGSMSLLALFATAYAVMPTFVEMYDALEMPVPPISAAIMVISDATVIVLALLFGSIIAYMVWWFVFGRTWDKWRTFLDAYSLQMPLMGEANMAQQTYQLLKILSAYISVGSPEREALVDAAAATKNRAIKKHLLTTAELMMSGRRTFADTFDSEMFPSLAKRILAIGEKAGRVPETIQELERVYEREAEVANEQAIGRVSGTVAGISSLIFTIVVTMVTVPPLEMFGSTLNYGN